MPALYIVVVLGRRPLRLPLQGPSSEVAALSLLAPAGAGHTLDAGAHRRSPGGVPRPGGGPLSLVRRHRCGGWSPASRTSWPTSTGCAPSSTSEGSGSSREEERFDLLQPLVDITTTLDPRLEIAYRYGASFLAEPFPIGAGKPEEAVALLERGVANLPRSWLLRQNLGFYTYFFLHDARRAADALLAARDLPGAPAWLETMAADFLGKGGDRETARQMWSRMYENQEEGPLKWNARSQLQRLDALDAVDILNKLVGEFRNRRGRWPASLQELGQAGLLPFPAVDPTRVPFHYDPQEGRVEIAQASGLWRQPGPLGSGLR